MPDADPEHIEAVPNGTGSEKHPGASREGLRRRRTRRKRRLTLRSRAVALLAGREAIALGVLIALALGVAVLAIGAVHPIVVLLVVPFAMAAGLFAVSVEGWSLREVPVPVLVLVGLSLYTALQAVPIPFRLLQALSPETASIWASSRLPLREPTPAFASVSLDPGASCLEALKWYGYAAIFAGAVALARRVGTRVPLATVFCIACIVAVVTVLHGLLGAEKVYGVYQPEQARPPWALAPLLNANNLAGYLNLGAFCGLGLALAPRAIAPRWLLMLAVVFMAAVGILEGSRGGVGALAIGLLLLSVGLWRLRKVAPHLRAPRPPAWLPLLAVGGGAAALVAAGGNETVWDQLLDETTTKLAMVEWSRPMLARFPWFGIGRGAFETGFPAYRQMPGHFVFQHAENFAVQWVAEWGIPVAAFAVGLLCWTLRPSRLRAGRDALAMATLCGVAALLLQNIVDLGLEVTSIGLAFFAVLGSLFGGAARARERDTRNAEEIAGANRPGMRFSRHVILAAAALALITFCAAARYGRHDALDDRNDVEAELHRVRYNDRASLHDFDELVTVAIHRHPGDPYFQVAGAVAAMHRGTNPFRWLGEAVRRDPLSGRAHLLLADALLGTRRTAQGLLELRLAAERDPSLSYPIAARALTETHDMQSLLSAVPTDASGVPVLVSMAAILGAARDRSLKQALLERALAAGPRNSAALEANGSALADELERRAADGICFGPARTRCISRLEGVVVELAKVAPGSLAAVQLRARLLVVQGRVAEAEQLLETRCVGFADSLGCLQLRVVIAWESADAAAVERASNAYQTDACRTSAGCARGATWLGDLYASQGDWLGAVKRYERAAQEEQTGEAWLKASDAALRAGLSARASVALSNAARCGGVSREEIDRRTRKTLGQVLQVDTTADSH